MEKVFSKKVRFDYFQICLKEFNGKDIEYRLFDLSSILEIISDFKPQETNFILSNGDEVRIQYTKLKKINGIDVDVWQQQFIRMRSGIVAGIATENGDFKAIELEEDEGLGEDIAVLYDKALSVIAIQRNRNSISPSGICEYLNKLHKDHIPEKSEIVFMPILTVDELPDYSGETIYRKIKFNFAALNTDVLEANKSQALAEIAKVKDRFPDIIFKIELSVGRADKTKGLPNDESNRIIRTLMDESNSANVKGLQVALKRDAECKVEHFDLIETKVYDHDSFSYTKLTPIKHEDIMEAMERKYKNRRQYLNSVLKYKNEE